MNLNKDKFSHLILNIEPCVLTSREKDEAVLLLKKHGFQIFQPLAVNLPLIQSDAYTAFLKELPRAKQSVYRLKRTNLLNQLKELKPC